MEVKNSDKTKYHKFLYYVERKLQQQKNNKEKQKYQGFQVV